jgi:hypothetical protein
VGLDLSFLLKASLLPSFLIGDQLALAQEMPAAWLMTSARCEPNFQNPGDAMVTNGHQNHCLPLSAIAILDGVYLSKNPVVAWQ